MLHVAPETFFQEFFRTRFGQYETADLVRTDVDHQVDLIALPFANESYDFIFASHVLEHILDDRKALTEIWRVLKPGGIAILPVPLVSEYTIEYPEPNPDEAGHVRAPGYTDYFDRYREIFGHVELISSSEMPEKYQTYVYEDRTHYPNAACPWRSAMPGERHSDIVPICYRGEWNV